VGDQLLGADGKPTSVVAATDVMLGRPCYEVTFSDGTRIVADAQHQWQTSTRAERRSGGTGSIRTTEELATSVRLKGRDARHNHVVVTAAALDLPTRTLPIPPYALGVVLAAAADDGRVPVRDSEVVMHLEAEGVDVTSAGSYVTIGEVELLTGLGVLGPLGDRHLPVDYLRADIAQREALLAGLMDATGTVTPTGALHFSTVNRQLAFDVQELVVGLGHLATMTARRVEGPTEDSRTSYTLDWCTDRRVFRVEAKHLQHKDLAAGERRSAGRWITSVTPVDSVPVRCVEVDNVDHLYLASRAMVPTHNSTLGLDIARSASIKHGQASVIFSLEMSKTEITMRLLSAEARVPLHHMRAGSMTDDDWARLARRMGEVAEAPLYIDDSPNLTMMEIRAKARRLKQRNELRLIVIDYLQLMSGNKKAESRQQEVSELSRALKLLAKELEVPVIAMSQLNRGAEQRTDKKPLLADLRESGSIEQDADMVLLLHREDAYEKESPRAGEADFIVAKHRNGPTATITVAFQGHYSRFVDMSPS
ncbi:MAG: DnaB helicase-like protein, partial [Frankiales bacterium]|nr:DnaB helicase-like protein [Frankiales bacterium]